MHNLSGNKIKVISVLKLSILSFNGLRMAVNDFFWCSLKVFVFSFRIP